MVDMSQFIAAKSDQLNAEDLVAGPRTITITKVTGNASPEQPVNIWFEDDGGKPWRPCKTARRVMVRVWGADASQYVGRALTLYRDPKVKFGGMEVGGIRISHMSHMEREETMALMASQKRMQPVTIKPLKVQRAPSTSAQQPAAAEGAVAGGGFDLGEPDHVETAATLDRRYREAATLEDLQRLWAETANDRKAVIRADEAFKDVFAKVLEREKARLVGEVA